MMISKKKRKKIPFTPSNRYSCLSLIRSNYL